MKINMLCCCFILIAATFLMAEPTNTKKEMILFEEFGVTVDAFEDKSDWNKIINDLFGDEYRVADWNDLKEYYQKGGDLIRLFDVLELYKYNSHAFLTRDGNKSYSPERYYFASRHTHDKPEEYLAHDHINHYMISLGSWEGSRKILAIKKQHEAFKCHQNIKNGKVVHTVKGTWKIPVTAVYNLSSKETIIRLEGDENFETTIGFLKGNAAFEFSVFDVPEGKYTLKLLWGGVVVRQKEILVNRDLSLMMIM